LKLFEFEAKGFMKKAGIQVPQGIVCETVEEVRNAFIKLGGDVVLKSQVHVGGRGKAGGIKFPEAEEEASEMAGQLFNMKIKDESVERILVEKALDIKEEYYLGIITDPDASCPLLMFSADGGMDIEELAATKPDAIRKITIDPRYGLFGFRVQYELKKAGVEKGWRTKVVDLAKKLFQIYWAMDGELIEINPLVITDRGDLVAADAKGGPVLSLAHPEKGQQRGQRVRQRSLRTTMRGHHQPAAGGQGPGNRFAAAGHFTTALRERRSAMSFLPLSL